MPTTVTRTQLYELVWSKTMRDAAKELSVSDSGLRNICLKHGVPTPRAGYWMKVAHGKKVHVVPLTDPDDDRRILIFGHGGPADTELMASARADVIAALERAGDAAAAASSPVVERTLTKLGKAKRNSAGLVVSQGARLVRMAVRPESLERAGQLLIKLVAAGEAAGLKLFTAGEGAAWQCDGQTVASELVEAADQVEHVATAKELAAIEKWKRERDDHHRSYGYWRDWGEPKIPKWEQRYQGRLQVRLEEVRLKSEQSPWGQVIRRTFSETRTRQLNPPIPRIIAAVAAIAAAKHSNAEFDERERLAARDAAERRIREERRRLIDQRALAVVEQPVDLRAEAERMRAVIEMLRGADIGARTATLLDWAERRLQLIEDQLGPAAIEARLAKADLFGANQSE